jgi:hypothetical protein
MKKAAGAVPTAFFDRRFACWLDEVREQRDQHDDRNRHAKQPKNDASTHGVTPFLLFLNELARAEGRT